MRNSKIKKVAFIICLMVSIFSCKNNENKIMQSENKVSKQKDTIFLTKPLEKQILKNCIIDENYFNEKTKTAITLTSDEIKSLNLTIIENINSDENAQIKIIDTLFAIQENKMIVVSQESENESIAYIINLNKKGKAFQFEPIFYTDIVEYISSTYSKIKDNKIEIITETDNGEEKPKKETMTLHFKNGKIEK
jgi:hypothetical protein